ncbi:MAG: hypothetical protein E7Z79_06435 [Methanobrevibacter thaueri]|uniref:Uncharacterized protein n=1 Tax=Methanobrevibacter thaueri TaxID=190975 RepID=A0A8T3VFM0_9EURY|nr:hypothetical protein [Methanobrevibacter thaueri]MBE6502064.1 hypothetical protein [Methanobrevibacter thaueri]
MTKYIRKNKSSYNVVKSSRSYGKFQNIDDATFIRDLLAENDWNPDLINQTYEVNGQYLVLGVLDEKIHILAKCNEKPSQKTIDELVKRKRRNPNGSRYGLNITRVFDTFVIKKRIAGDDYVFGYYDRIEDAEFVRNHLLDNQWNVNSFSQIQYCEDTDDYRVVEVIDDKAYVLASFKDKNSIDLDEVHREFLNRITKHKLGLAQHPYLDDLKNSVPELEERFNTKAQDDVWDFKSTQNPLNDIIFSLAPFQKSVYDAVDDSTVEDIEKSLVRFRSGNFTQKIQRNLDELEKKGLIAKNQNHYIKQNK